MGSSYPQYLLPVIIVQVTLLGALTTVDRAARDHAVRLRGSTPHTSHIHGGTADGSHVVLPLPRRPRPARRDRRRVRVRLPNGRRVRLPGGFHRACPDVDAGTFARRRCDRGVDRLGLRSARNGGSSQLLLVPQLLLVMLSTGMAPVDSFPDWLHAFVRYQPVSQVTDTLRGFASGPCDGRQSGDQLGVVRWAAGGVRRTRGADAEADAMTTNAPPRSSLVGESLLFAGQLLTHWRRAPMVPIQALLFPTFLLITYYLLVGKSMMRITGTDSLYGLVPTCAVAGAIFGALAAGLTILPRARQRSAQPTVGVAGAPGQRPDRQAARRGCAHGVGTAVITAVGVGLGLRFEGSWLAVIPFLLVPMLVAVVFSMAVIAIAVRAKRRYRAHLARDAGHHRGVRQLWHLLPLESLPSWMWPLLPLQPMAPAIESMRALAQGDPALWPLLLSLGWALGLAAVVGPLAVRGYRAAAESGH